MKKLISILLLLAMLACLWGCQQAPVKTESTTEAEEILPEDVPIDEGHMLHNKRVIFIGNSYTHYGNCVITKDVQIQDQTQRNNDLGYFYQICRRQGAKPQVTNWTYGTHSLEDLFGGNCAAGKGCDGVDHKRFLKDPYYDYVFLQEHTGSDIGPADLIINVDRAAAFFREANPDVKIILLVPFRIYDAQYQTNRAWLPFLKEIEAKGIQIVEWGALVEDVIQGKAVVEGSQLTYNRNSFIVDQSEIDGYHQNMLAGYITAQMAYCAITGESAQGMPYDFCTNSVIHTKFSTTAYEAKHYTRGGTNMASIFKSEADMLGLQKLMDQYLAEKYYLTY